MTDRLFSDCCYGTKHQHREDEQCPCAPSRFFKLPLRFVEPQTDSDWPKVVDAEGGTVAHLFWPAHDGDDTEQAEQATYALGRAFAAIAQTDGGKVENELPLADGGPLPLAASPPKGESGLIAEWERLETAFHDALPGGQGEPGDGGVAGKALCQFLYDNSDTIRAALAASPPKDPEWMSQTEMIERAAAKSVGATPAPVESGVERVMQCISEEHHEPQPNEGLVYTYGEVERGVTRALAASGEVTEAMIDKRLPDMCAAVEADAVSALRYIEMRYGRLEGVGWDRVFNAHDELFMCAAQVGG